MRKDMKKVLTERPRRGHGRSYREVRARQNRGDWDNMPSHQGMRIPYGWECKEFSDLIGPLVRYLWSCRGRRWDDVWSEVCEQLSGNTVDSHLKDHVRMEVDVHVDMCDGKAYAKAGGRFYFSGREVTGLYVNPQTGILCGEGNPGGWRNPMLRARPHVIVDGLAYTREDNGILRPFRRRHGLRGLPNDGYARKLIGPEKEAVFIGGIWYWVIFDDVPAPLWDRTPHLPDRAINRSAVDIVTGAVVRTGRYRARKQQMGAVDLRRHGLVNDI